MVCDWTVIMLGPGNISQAEIATVFPKAPTKPDINWRHTPRALMLAKT